MNKVHRMQIRFESDGHEIDANTLVNYLIHFNSIVALANEEFGQGNKKVTLKVNALSEGSFVIDMSLVEGVIASLFNAGNIEYLANLTDIINGVYTLYKERKGKPVKEEEKSNIIYIDNSTTINAEVINFYNNQTVRKAISKSFESIDQDDGVNGVELNINKKDNVVHFKKEEFEEMKYDDFDKEGEESSTRKELVEARLTITSVNFQPGKRWTFIYNGFAISMTVKDDALMERINNGARFGKGDAIRVRMAITQEYDKKYDAYVNKSYKIVEFLEHIKAPVQGELFEG